MTDARVIDATVRACAALFPAAERITVGDCLEQRADWPLMCRQSGLLPIMDALAAQDSDTRRAAAISRHRLGTL